MDIRKVKKLIELVESSDVAEIEIKTGDEAIRIARFSQQAATVAMPVAPPVAAAPAPATAPETAASSAAPASPDSYNDDQLIRAPMVGTYYSAPSPGAAPFVELGQTVSAGQTICIIEAMKMLNQIEAPRSGTVVEILVGNEESVEYDQPLLVLE